MSVHSFPEPEFHTDAPANADELAIAFEAMLPVTDGDKPAAAILAIGAVLADVINRRERT